jgi:transposase
VPVACFNCPSVKEDSVMLRGGDVNDIHEFKRQGLSISQISSLTGFDRKTIRKYLNGRTTPRYGPRLPRGSKLDPFKPYIRERLAAGVWNARVLLRELKERGYSGQYTVLTDFLRPLRKEAVSVAVRRFETPPGHQAQVDWGELGHIETAEGRKTLYGFVFTLGHSRALFADIATDTRLATLLRLHEAAFAELGGVPREILYDRMKTVVLGTDDRGETIWNPVFLDFARYWGFTPRACRAYRPQTKGKVENGIGYLRKNFLCGREADGVSDLRSQLRTWVWQVANQRIHGTTHRHVFAAWNEEKIHLLPLVGRCSYPYAGEEARKVSRDAFVSFKGNRYSVPWRVAGQEVVVREVEGQLLVQRGKERLAVHRLCPPGSHQTVTIPAHHVGIPLGDSGRGGKARIQIRAKESDLPVVEVRSLLAYELISGLSEGRQHSQEREALHG